MSDYKIFNDIGEERTWEELYEDNVMLVKYTDKLEKRIDKAIEYIGYSKEISNPQDYIKFERKLLEILRGKDE